MNKVRIQPNNDRVLIRVPKADWNSLFSKYVEDKNGKKVELFVDVEEQEGYDRRMQQNISVAKVVAVGVDVNGIQNGDMAIVDYLVTGTNDMLVGASDGERIFSVPALTTYHEEDSVPTVQGRLTHSKGDFDNISPVFGFVRAGKVYTFPPYVILKKDDKSSTKVSASGIVYEEDSDIVEMEVLSDSENFKCGDIIIINKNDTFEREIAGKSICVCFDIDVIGLA